MTFIFNPFTGNFDADTSVSLSAVGSSPNANAATLTGQVLNLEPASGSFPGVVTTGAQTFAGAKTFSSTIVGSISGNAATVTTNANLTGDVTSVGNATSYSATLPLNKGGTGQTTKAPAFDALSPMSASGDIIYGGASGTGTRLAKSSDGNVLTLASGVPTWAAPSGGTSITARASTSAGQTINNGSTDIVNFGTVTYDSGSNITTGASWKFTVPTGGAGVFNCCALVTAGSITAVLGQSVQLKIFKNGNQYTIMYPWLPQAAAVIFPVVVGSDSISLADGDYIDFRITNSSGSNITLINDGDFNHVAIQKVG